MKIDLIEKLLVNSQHKSRLGLSQSTASESSSDTSRHLQFKQALATMPVDTQIAVQQPARPVQFKGTEENTGNVHAAAAHGIQGAGESLPHLKRIQESFGQHDVSGVQAHTGNNAQVATKAMGSEGFATGNHVAFAGTPSLHTAAHEAAHVVQQRSGVSLKGGVGAVNDPYEQHADAVADAVVQGKSAEPLLSGFAGGASQEGAVQPKRAAQAENLLVQCKLILGKNTGWGAFGWVSGGKELWNKLDTKFNTTLVDLKKTLTGLEQPTETARKSVQDAISKIDAVVDKYDGAIHHDKAEALDKVLDKTIAQANEAIKTAKLEAKMEPRRQKINPLVERLGTVLSSKKINYQNFPGLADSRKDLVKELNNLIANVDEELDESALKKKVKKVEDAYDNAVLETVEAKKKSDKEKEEANEKALKEEEAKQEAEEKEKEVRNEIKAKIPAYNQHLSKCKDLTQLQELVKLISKGDGGKLSNSLATAGSGDALLKIMAVHASSIDHVNKLLGWLGSTHASLLVDMLKAISKGKEETLLNVFGKIPKTQAPLVTPLLGLLGLKTLETLLDQGDAAKLTTLFVTGSVNVVSTKALLKTKVTDSAVFMLGKVPDSKFLVKLEPMATTEEEMVALVSDLPNQANAVNDIKALFNGSTTVTMSAIKALLNVKKARGVRTNAGATIGEVTPDGLGSAHEKMHVKAGLKAIASGKAQTLTHSNNARFGDPFDNNQGRLPGIAGAGGYSEYYVEKAPDADTYHGERRLVKNDTTEHIYYSDDHYTSFRRIA